MVLSIFLNHSLESNVTEIIVRHYIPVMSDLLVVRFFILRRNCVCVCVCVCVRRKRSLLVLFPFEKYA